MDHGFSSWWYALGLTPKAETCKSVLVGISSSIAVVLVVAAIVGTAVTFCICQRLIKKKSSSVSISPETNHDSVRPNEYVELTAITRSDGGEELVAERESEECDSLSDLTTTTAEIHSIPVTAKSSPSTNPESPSPSNRSSLFSATITGEGQSVDPSEKTEVVRSQGVSSSNQSEDENDEISKKEKYDSERKDKASKTGKHLPLAPAKSFPGTILEKPIDPPQIRVWHRKPSLPRPFSGPRRRSSTTSASLEEDQMPICNPITEDFSIAESPLGPINDEVSENKRKGSDSKRERKHSKITEKHCIPPQSPSNRTFSLTQRVSASRRRSSTTSTGSTLEAEKLIPNSPLAQVAYKAGSQVDDDSD
jgi:hypothetical protein